MASQGELTLNTDVVIDAVVSHVELVDEPVGIGNAAADFHSIVHHEHQLREQVVYIVGPSHS